jgi:hypothetical protein
MTKKKLRCANYVLPACFAKSKIQPVLYSLHPVKKATIVAWAPQIQNHAPPARLTTLLDLSTRANANNVLRAASVGKAASSFRQGPATRVIIATSPLRLLTP